MRDPMFFGADCGRFQDEIEQAIWELMVNHNIDRKRIIRLVEESLDNVEYQLGEARKDDTHT